jgi:hypothetical protein
VEMWEELANGSKPKTKEPVELTHA